MTNEEVLELIVKIMTEVPEAVEGLGNMAGYLLNGDADKAVIEARLVAETAGIKRAARAAYDVP